MIPKIEAFKKQHDWLNSNDAILLPPETPFGNLTLKWFDFMQRFDNINDKIDDIYTCHERIKQNRTEKFDEYRQFLMTKIFSKHRYLIEELIYWLRKSADEMISLVYILDYYSNHKKYPEKIVIESIGKLLKEKCLCNDFFSDHYDMLKTINDVSNAYKHSFLNTEISNHIGNDEPYFFALSLSNNDLKKKPYFYPVELTNFIIKYSGFCTSYKQLIIKYQNEFYLNPVQ